MTASDPTFGVATPTGVLEGVAAFGWDGSQWQPSGRAAYGVGTPTGVLRGVAPFSWSGSAWTPAGQAGPSVATPSGVLQGVAVYTWNGSAWTPAGGGPGSATPTGVLRGVAAFAFDGTQWQPAGQAGPDVATPFGVLQGVAMFRWSGNAWSATAPSLDLDFMAPGALNPRITFTRASTATYFDITGAMQTAAVDAPRWDYDPVTHALNGLLIEISRANVLLNSASPGTQSVAVTAQAYTLSFYGTGTITLSGASTAGPLTGTGAFPQRVALTFTPTAGTLTCTVTGGVLNANLEAGPFRTSWIPTTAAPVTRAADYPIIAAANTAGWFAAPGGSWAAEFMHVMPTIPTSRRVVSQILSAGATPLNVNTAVNLTQYDGIGNVAAVGTVSPSVVHKGASNWAPGSARICLDGGAVASAATLTAGFSSLGTSGIYFMSNAAVPADSLTGWLRRVRYWPRVLSDSELQAVTT